MTQEFPRRRTSPAIILFSIIIPAAIIVGVLWFIWVQKPRILAQQNIHETAMQTIGLGRPVANRLDERFSDGNHDDVADPPADAAKLLDPPTLVFSYVALEDPAGYKAAFADFMKHLAATTGKQVEYLEVTATTDQLKALRDGKLHVTGFNTGSVPIAVGLCGFVPAFKLATPEGKAATHTLIIVPAGSPIQSPSDLRQHELTLTEPNSNSGYKAPIVLLRNHFNLEPERDYLLRFSGSYEESINGIKAKEVQSAAISSDVLDRAVTRGDIPSSAYKVIYTSESFPTACFGYAHNLRPELAAKVRAAFDSFQWQGTTVEKEFAQSNQSRFVPATFKEDWSLVRMIDNQIGNAYKLD